MNKTELETSTYCLHSECIKLEEQLLMKIAIDILGRDWQESDGNMFQRVFRQGDDMNYELSYNGSKIGTVKHGFIESTYSVLFQPETN